MSAKTGTADTILRWNGQAQDADIGLYYLRARYYDPTTAQFLSADPLAAMTRAIYNYADNNPLNHADPLGLFSDARRTYESLSQSPNSVFCEPPSAGSSPTATDPYADAQGYAMIAGDFCVFVCLNASLNWGPQGIYVGYGGGFGLRVEASVGVGGGYGVLSPTGNVSAECGGFLPWGLSAGMSFTPPGGYATTGYGLGLGCSLNFGNYTKIH